MAAKERRESNAPTNFKRVEEKYRLSHEESRELFARLAERAEVEDFIPGQPVARLTTLYCDGPSLPFFRAALRLLAEGPDSRRNSSRSEI